MFHHTAGEAVPYTSIEQCCGRPRACSDEVGYDGICDDITGSSSQPMRDSGLSRTMIPRLPRPPKRFPGCKAPRDTTGVWRGKNTVGVGAFSDAFTFVTAIPAPAAPSPCILLPMRSMWKSHLPCVGQRWQTAVTYRLQMATDSLFVVRHRLQRLDAYGHGQSHACAQQSYKYLAGDAKNTAVTSAYSATRAFTTISAVPLAPVHISPPNSAVNQQINVVLRLEQIGRCADIRLQVATDGTFASGIRGEI